MLRSKVCADMRKKGGREMRLAVRFTKGAPVRFVSHLDVQRLFQRAFRRAKLP
ncbi:MAG: DUF2344 domain-containing protein, partial [Clostridia bacterium]|nr:DUF2344 domain-containing protein [Clostridia bacterium]